jgi:hypothetical protein
MLTVELWFRAPVGNACGAPVNRGLQSLVEGESYIPRKIEHGQTRALSFGTLGWLQKDLRFSLSLELMQCGQNY